MSLFQCNECVCKCRLLTRATPVRCLGDIDEEFKAKWALVFDNKDIITIINKISS